MTEYNGVEGEYLSNMDEIRYAKQLGMDAYNYHVTYNTESLFMISTAILHMKKPVYFHCYVSYYYYHHYHHYQYLLIIIISFQDGYTATLFAQLHLYTAGTVDSQDIFTNSIAYGYDYQADSEVVAYVNKIAKTSFTVVEPSLELTLPEGTQSYRYYYWSHRAGDDLWYNIGQVLDTQPQTIYDSGYKSVISFRNNGESTVRLSTDPQTGAVENHEFGDANGLYSVEFEKSSMESVGLKFYNLPVTGSSSWSVDTLNKYEPYMAEAESFGPVLAHCASGYRSSGYVIAYLGRKQKKCTDWALKQTRRLGYSFDQNSSDEQVVQFFRDALQC